jgi:hypothetical protein
MSSPRRLSYYRLPWPEKVIPDGAPRMFFYEVDVEADLVLRWVEIFPDGRIERNSVELEQANGDTSPSLFEHPWSERDADIEIHEIQVDDFEGEWTEGKDTPCWFPNPA